MIRVEQASAPPPAQEASAPGGISVSQVPRPNPEAPTVALGTGTKNSFLPQEIDSETKERLTAVYQSITASLTERYGEVAGVKIGTEKHYISYLSKEGEAPVSRKTLYLSGLGENDRLVILFREAQRIPGVCNKPIQFGKVAAGSQAALSRENSPTLQKLPRGLQSFLEGPTFKLKDLSPLTPFKLYSNSKEYWSKPYFHALIDSFDDAQKPEAAAKVFAIEKYHSLLRERITARIATKAEQQNRANLEEFQRLEQEIEELNAFTTHLRTIDPFALYWAAAHLPESMKEAEDRLKETFRTTHRFLSGKDEEFDRGTPEGEYARDVGDLLAPTQSALSKWLAQEGRDAKAERVERLLLHHMNGTYTDPKYLASYGIRPNTPLATEVMTLLDDCKREADQIFQQRQQQFTGCTTKEILSRARPQQIGNVA